MERSGGPAAPSPGDPQGILAQDFPSTAAISPIIPLRASSLSSIQENETEAEKTRGESASPSSSPRGRPQAPPKVTPRSSSLHPSSSNAPSMPSKGVPKIAVDVEASSKPSSSSSLSTRSGRSKSASDKGRKSSSPSPHQSPPLTKASPKDSRASESTSKRSTVDTFEEWDPFAVKTSTAAPRSKRDSTSPKIPHSNSPGTSSSPPSKDSRETASSKRMSYEPSSSASLPPQSHSSSSSNAHRTSISHHMKAENKMALKQGILMVDGRDALCLLYDSLEFFWYCDGTVRRSYLVFCTISRSSCCRSLLECDSRIIR